MNLITIILAVAIIVTLVVAGYIAYNLSTWKMELRLKKLRKTVSSIRASWQEVEDRFIEDGEFRQMIAEDPAKLASFLAVTDKMNRSDDLCYGLDQIELKKLFEANPELKRKRVDEYIHLRRSRQLV